MKAHDLRKIGKLESVRKVLLIDYLEPAYSKISSMDANFSENGQFFFSCPLGPFGRLSEKFASILALKEFKMAPNRLEKITERWTWT